jgi:hypothetical protein
MGSLKSVNCVLLIVILIILCIYCFKDRDGFLGLGLPTCDSNPGNRPSDLACCTKWNRSGKTCRSYSCNSKTKPSDKWVICDNRIGWCTKNTQRRDSDREKRKNECKDADNSPPQSNIIQYHGNLRGTEDGKESYVCCNYKPNPLWGPRKSNCQKNWYRRKIKNQSQCLTPEKKEERERKQKEKIIAIDIADGEAAGFRKQYVACMGDNTQPTSVCTAIRTNLLQAYDRSTALKLSDVDDDVEQVMRKWEEQERKQKEEQESERREREQKRRNHYKTLCEGAGGPPLYWEQIGKGTRWENEACYADHYAEGSYRVWYDWLCKDHQSGIGTCYPPG